MNSLAYSVEYVTSGIKCQTLPPSLSVLYCPAQEFLCPISLDIMIDPVLLLPTGQIYDYHSLINWFESGVLPPPLFSPPCASEASCLLQCAAGCIPCRVEHCVQVSCT